MVSKGISLLDTGDGFESYMSMVRSFPVLEESEEIEFGESLVRVS